MQRTAVNFKKKKKKIHKAACPHYIPPSVIAVLGEIRQGLKSQPHLQTGNSVARTIACSRVCACGAS